MSVYTSIGIIILSMLILAFMQLPSGVFALFHHYASGKYSKKQTSFLSTYYFLGVETITACLFISCTYLAYLFSFLNISNPLCNWIAGLVFLLLSFASCFCYFRHGNNSKTFIPRSIAKALDHNARTAKSRSDVFILGAFSGICELIFTLPIFIAVASILPSVIIAYPNLSVFILFFILSPLIPLFFYRSVFHHDRNLADILRFRFKNKSFVRLVLSLCYFVIALLIIFLGF